MNQDDIILCRATLQYFGAMLPLHSHEAKNALAVINENAGLMDDYIRMSKKGKSLDLERLSSLSASISKQVVRLNGLITDVRQTADGIDKGDQDICLVRHARQVSELLSKKAATQSIRFEVYAVEEPIPIHTRPVLLLHTMWRCLDYAVHASKQGQCIGLTLEQKTDSATLRISGIDELEPGSIRAIMPDEQRSIVLAVLKAELTIDGNEKTMMLSIRKDHV